MIVKSNKSFKMAGHSTFYTCMLLASLLASNSVFAIPILNALSPDLHNANHVFNAIHSSMRQWGSSLNHNGMSFFMATVPAGTQLYHGTWNPDVVIGMEWLAFEPEHALVFARPMRPPPGGEKHEPFEEETYIEHRGYERFVDDTLPHAPRKVPSYPLPDPNRRLREILNAKRRRLPNSYVKTSRSQGDYVSYLQTQNQDPLTSTTVHPSTLLDDADDDPLGQGYLHTYVPVHPLHLLYIDGLSAGKTHNGTLDTQDLLLLANTTHPSPPQDYQRAQGLCALVSTLWNNRIDGILRMEGGFEIILCEFERHVVRRSVVSVGQGGRHAGSRIMSDWRYVQAVAARYGGIGGGRVELDYSDFVSVFAFDAGGALDLWRNDVVSDTAHPRLVNAAPERLGTIGEAVTRMVLGRGERGGARLHRTRNWQAVADMVVKRYSAALHHLHTDGTVRSSKKAYAARLSTLLRPFIVPSARNMSLETLRCTTQLVPPIPLVAPPPLAHTTIHTITSHICSTLIAALDVSNATPSRSLAATSSPPYVALDLIDGLVHYLQWTTWKECGPCADEQVCFIPMWPMGSLENHRSPRCMGEEGVGQGYWGWWGRGRGQRGDGPGPRPCPKHHTGHQRPGGLEAVGS